MADFTPPPLSSHTGPTPAAQFTPPPLSSHTGPTTDDDYSSHAVSSTWDNLKGAFNLATGADLWSHGIEAAKSGNYDEAAKAFQGIVDGPASRMADGVIDTAKVALGHMKNAAAKLIHGDVQGATASSDAAGVHLATVLAPHADQAAENYKQGKYRAAAGDLTGDAIAYLAAKGVHAVPGAASAASDAVSTAATAVKDAANHPLAGAAVDALGVIHPGAASAIHLGARIVKVAGKIKDAVSPGGPPPGADTGRPVGGPAPMPASQMRTPQFEDVPDVARTAGPEAPPTAGPPLTSRPIGAPQPVTPDAMRTPQFEDVPDVARRTNVPADQAAAAANPADALRDGIAQGFQFKNYADAVKKGAGPTVDRLVEQQSGREAPAARPSAPFTPPPLSSHTGPTPAPPAAIPRAETLKPDVAKTLQEGAVRENPDGSRQVLQRVPLDKIASDPGNEIYPDVVGSYQRNGYSVHPELRANEEGGLTVQEGHHRLAADAKNGKTDVLAWAPEAARPAAPPPAAAPPAEPPTVLQAVDQGIARRRMPGMNYQDVDAYLASKRAAQQPPPGEPGEAASPAATPPPPASPAAPAATKPPAPYGKQYITPGQVTKYAADNGLDEADATAALEKQGVSVVDRASTNRVLHGIGAELGYDHGTLSEIAHATYGKGLGKITHEQMMELAEKLGNEQGTKEPLATKRAGSPADPAIADAAEGAPHGGVVAQLPPSELSTDPVRFQFKQDAIGKGGVTDKFRDTTQWNADNSGILSVWKDPVDGKTYVVNGHHRLEMANRLGAKTVTVRYLDAANAAEARMKGALINISEDQGTSIDAAKVFRDSGMTAADLQKQGIKLDGRIAKEGQALANLEPNIFNQVVSGEMKPERGAMIGQVAEHADQSQLAKLLRDREASGKPMTDSQVGELVRMQAPQVTETQHSLFGDDEISRSLIAEKAGVSDYVQSRLTQKRRTFNAVGNERAATRLAEAGNVIDADKNAAIAEATNQEHAVYQKLSTSTGPVADALDEAAKALHSGENPAIVKVRTYAKIEPILKAEADKLTGRSGASGERPEGSAQPGSREAGRGKHDTPGAAQGSGKPAAVAEAADEDLEAPLRESLKKARVKKAAKISDLMGK